MNDKIVSYPDLQEILQRAKGTGEDHFKTAWSIAHNMKYEDVTDEQAKECAYVYYAILSQCIPRGTQW